MNEAAIVFCLWCVVVVVLSERLLCSKVCLCKCHDHKTLDNCQLGSIDIMTNKYLLYSG